ncbi:protein shroom2-like [Plakobranchus ocellatus]|uniref:Protein shroom2-like n=1 Tax=Plakobranchus ocellatus TaxID=259542 RepID=A0AAV3Y2H4_9GAST|nr:protein shroom2-like [Plakobranchus ocellatus]
MKQLLRATEALAGFFKLRGRGERFAEDSYIGHKNKSSRPIGTYQRSKSAAVLPTSGAVSTSNSSISNSGSSSNISGVGAGLHTRSVSTADSTGLGAGVSVGADGVDESPGVFPSSRLAHQQGWTSEIVLSSATGAVDPGLGGGPGESSPPSSLLSPSGRNFDQPPARPARPNVQHARFDSGGSGGFGDQTTGSSIPVSSTVNTAAGPADSTLSSVSPSSFHRDNVNSNVPRRQPPPLPNSPPYDGHRQTPGGVAACSDNSVLPGQSQFWPKSGASGASDLSSPQRRPYPGSLKDKQWMSQDTGSHRFPATPSPSSSQANPTSSTSSPPRSPGEVGAPPLTLPPKDYYRRRDSAPARPPNNSVNTSAPESPSNSKLQPPHDPPERRQSDSTPPNITATGNSVSTNSRSVSLHTVSLSPSHSRQPSQEELECDQKALMLAQHLAGQGADHQKLSEVLRSDTNKKRMQFMDGLFSQSLSSAPNSSLDGSLPSTNKAAISSPSSSSSSPGGSSVAPAAGSSPYGSSASTSVSPAGYGATASGNGVFSRALAQNGSSTPDAHSDHNQRGKTLPKEYWMSPSKAALEMEWRRNEGLTKELTRDISDSGSLVKQKEELLEKLHKKLEILKEGKISLQQEIADNDLLGTQVRTQVEARCQSRAERDKFTSFLEDLEKIVRLLLNLSGQLARAENAVQALAPEVDGKLRKLTLDKRERLYAKHEEAKLLKDDLDKRGEQVTAMLKERLSPEQLGDYVHYVRTRSQLTIDLQEMEDKITLGGEQIQALRKSIPDTPAMDTHGTPRSDTTDPSPS